MNGCDEDRVLIPGLPDDIALDCLARIPHRFHHSLRPVCRRWRDLVATPAFYLHRARIGTAEDLILFVQAQPLDGRSDLVADGENKDGFRPLASALAAYNASTGEWLRAAGAVPVFARVAAVEGGRVVVVGGWDPETLEPVAEVRVVDPVTGGWRPGKPMAAARSFFACAAAGGRVFVAGGHDGQKNAMRGVEAYDVDADEWVALPAMGEERDECQGVAVGGRFWAISGYGTEGQGRFGADGECYDPATGEWIRIEGVWEGGAAPSAAFYAAPGDKVRYVDGKGIREYDKGGWREVGKGPEGMRSAAVAVKMSGAGAGSGGGERVFVMGAETEGSGHAGWILEDGKWKRVSSPIAFSGSVHSAAVIQV